MSSAIDAGYPVLWNPPDLSRIFCEDAAFRFADRLPLPGTLSRVDGEIGRMSYLQHNGRPARVPVRLDELIAVGVAHGTE